ncbi:hypothetical protein [Alloprevotella tannerae]|uniref:hypothetical protein n=1 Tax=Alloprevotella tannerae TaxID=76122 RepID=UPI0028EA2D50|nr:hypothetical protein [Alloprevotella tannerae]
MKYDDAFCAGLRLFVCFVRLKKILNERRFAWIRRNYCLFLPRKTFQGGVSLRQSCKITFAFILKELADAIIGAVENSPRRNTS